jgi:hypothetical protein
MGRLLYVEAMSALYAKKLAQLKCFGNELIVYVAKTNEYIPTSDVLRNTVL